MNISMKAAKQALNTLYNDSADAEKTGYINLYNAFRMLRAAGLISHDDMDVIWKYDSELYNTENNYTD